MGMAAKPGMIQDIKQERDDSFTPDNIYQCAISIMYIMLFVLPLTFLFVTMEPKDEDRRLDDMMSAAGSAQLAEVTVGELLRLAQAVGLNMTLGAGSGA